MAFLTSHHHMTYSTPLCRVTCQGAGSKGAFATYLRGVEKFVRSSLEDSSNFHLAPGEFVYTAVAYNHAVRCSEARSQQRPGVSTRQGQNQSQSEHTARETHAGSVGKRRGVIADVHSDFTRLSGPAVLRHILCEDGAAGRAIAGLGEPPPDSSSHAEAILSGARDGGGGGSWRYVFVNVWRSMDREQPVSEWALALLHPRSWTLEGDGHVIKVKKQAIFPQNYAMRTRLAVGAAATKSQTLKEEEYEHEWLYYPAMTADEALVFVNFDSNESQPQFVVHGAFDCVDEEVIAGDQATFALAGGRGGGEEITESEEAPEAQAGQVEAQERLSSSRISVEVRVLVLIRSSSRQLGTKDETLNKLNG